MTDESESEGGEEHGGRVRRWFGFGSDKDDEDDEPEPGYKDWGTEDDDTEIDDER